MYKLPSGLGFRVQGFGSEAGPFVLGTFLRGPGKGFL